MPNKKYPVLVCCGHQERAEAPTHSLSTSRITRSSHAIHDKAITFDPGFMSLAGGLAHGEIVTGDIKDIPAQRNTAFRRMGLKTFALTPIFVFDEWVGFLGLSSNDEHSPWLTEDLNIIRSAAEMFGIYYEHERMGKQVRRSAETTRALLNAPTFTAVLMDVHGVVLELSASACTLFDMAQDGSEAIGTYLTSVMNQEHAAGVAHEINSPLQYINNYTQFLADAFGDLSELLGFLQEYTRMAKNCDHTCAIIPKAQAKVEEIDLGFLLEEIPNAIKHTTDGIEWVTKIVHSMKAFSHPGETGMTRVKLNKSIESALDVSRNEYKYVADIELDLADDLPLVTCLDGEQRKSANYPQLLL